MYRKDTEVWLKHYDFILLDMICLQFAFLIAYEFSEYGINPYEVAIYRNMALFIEVADLAVIFAIDSFKNVLKRGYYREFVKTIEQTLVLCGVSMFSIFILKQGTLYSRKAIMLTFSIYAFFSYLFRCIWKNHVNARKREAGKTSLLIVTTCDYAREAIKNVNDMNYSRYTITGLAIIDKDMTGQKIDGIEVVAGEKDTPEVVCRGWVDEVLLITPGEGAYSSDLIDKLGETGVTIHYGLAKLSNVPGKKQFVEKIGNYTVVTTSINYASAKELFVKRVLDIIGGLIGCIFTGILFIFVAPAIYIASPGPIFFSQERVGRNGKRFKLYKFRSMYMDAEERKAELMKQNKISDGKMFKMDFDPRVIGNKVLPDGTKKTGIGDFIRRTSIDEFPQFFNVLKGDSGIIGTTKKNLDFTRVSLA